MAAQINSRGYSLIEQGKIEEIIQAKPHELRSMIEEAAGLSLFKGRREISERKLERVKENLSRLNDVLSEIERQLNYARRQAKKAETYKVLRQEADTLERLSAARRLIELRDELEKQTGREVELREQVDIGRRRNTGLQAAFELTRVSEQTERERLAATLSELQNIRAGVEAYKEGSAEKLAQLTLLRDATAALYGSESEKALEAQRQVIAGQRQQTAAIEKEVEERARFTQRWEVEYGH